MSFIGLITKCKDEYFVQEFCEYYLHEGIDHIYIIDDQSNDQSIYDNLKKNPKVTITHEDLSEQLLDNRQMESINKIYQQVRNKYEWIIPVDVDEFIAPVANHTNTIRDELKSIFKEIDYIQIPWINMAPAWNIKSPKSVLRQIVYRWDYNKSHQIPLGIQKNYTRGKQTPQKFQDRSNNIECKPIFRTNAVDKISTSHFSKVTNSRKVNIKDSVELKQGRSDYPFYKGLNERNIPGARLLCYHYRNISIENNLKKIENNVFYKHYKPELLTSYDFPELIDNTLKNRSMRHQKNKTNASKPLTRRPNAVERLILLHKKKRALKYLQRMSLKK